MDPNEFQKLLQLCPNEFKWIRIVTDVTQKNDVYIFSGKKHELIIKNKMGDLP